MGRTRLSTTVDSERLEACRSLLKVPDSQLLDRALSVLLARLQMSHEIEALEAMPYERDPDLSWEAPPGPDLPYDGEIPVEVRALARRRRRRS